MYIMLNTIRCAIELCVVLEHQSGCRLLSENPSNNVKLGLQLLTVILIFNKNEAGADQGDA